VSQTKYRCSLEVKGCLRYWACAQQHQTEGQVDTFTFAPLGLAGSWLPQTRIIFQQSWRLRMNSGVRRKFSWGDFIQWHMVVICIWCALFVTSQYDVIFMFPNQCFGEVCW